MVKTLCGRVVAVVMLFVFVVLFAGCQQPQTSNEKRTRLLAAENLQLKRQLADRQAKLESLQKQQGQKLQQGQQELAKCQARVEQLQKDIDKGIAERVRDVTTKVMDENARLRKQIESLQVQLKQLKAEPNRP